MKLVFALGIGLLAAVFPAGSGFLLGCLAGYLLWEQQAGAKRIQLLEEQVRALTEAARRPAAAPARPAPPPEAPPLEVPPVEAMPREEAETPRSEGVEPPPVEPAPAAVAQGQVRPPFEHVPERSAYRHPAPVAPPAAPGWLAEGFEQVRAFVLGGNTLVRVGLAVLFCGFAFLVKYAADNDYFPVELRLAATAGAGIALVGLGWRLRLRRPDFALALQGGGAAILYLTIFASYRLYALLPSGAAFALLVATTGLCAALALQQSSQSLVVLSLLGGFFAPVIASTGAGSHVALFSYYGLLNAAILVLAWFRPWRVLHLVGFFCTFGIAGLWVSEAYVPALFASTEPFLLLFFVCYFSVALLHARHRRPSVARVIDGTLVFGLPVVVFSLQAVLVASFEYGLAWSALGFGCFYAAAAYGLYRRAPAVLRVLVEAFAGIGLVLGTMVLPFALDATWTGTGWALEGAALVWLGYRQGRPALRLSGALLQLGACVSFYLGTGGLPDEALPVLNRYFFGCLALSLSALATAFLAWRQRAQARAWEAPFEVVFLVIGLVWWLAGGTGEVVREVGGTEGFHLSVAHVAATALACALLWPRLGWPALRVPSLLLLPVLALLLLVASLDVSHPFESAGWAAWLPGLAVHLVALRRADASVSAATARGLHAGGLWFAAALLAWEGAWAAGQVAPPETIWSLAAAGLVLLLLVLGVAEFAGGGGWPLGAWRQAYLLPGALPLLAVVWAASFPASLLPADPAPLPYLPLLNPLDLVLGLTLVTAVTWHRAVRRLVPGFEPPGRRRLAWQIGAASVFVWLNATLARTIHAWAGVRYDVDALLASNVYQTALTIFWTALSVTTMAVAARRGARTPWMAGAGLLGVTVVKLAVVDSSSLSLIARIVTFIVVGMLLLLIGYLAPVPPQRRPDEEAAEKPAEVPL